MKNVIFYSFLLLLASCPLRSQTGNKSTTQDYQYAKPHLFTFIKNTPGDIKGFWNFTFRKENTWGIAAMAAGTGILIAKDQSILERTQALGDHLRITRATFGSSVMKTNMPFTNKKLSLNPPNNLGTAMYFLGDGIVHLGLAGGFLAYGLMGSDNRALATSSEIAESILAGGLAIRVLKNITGREDPSTSTAPGGKWRFLPNPVVFAKNPAHYDAFPSGHLFSAMATTTVIAENYSEYKFIKPLSYSLMGLLGFQMVNNGVHWASDYPLAIYMGYAFGHIAVNRGRTDRTVTGLGSLEFAPAIVGNGLGFRARVTF